MRFYTKIEKNPKCPIFLWTLATTLWPGTKKQTLNVKAEYLS